jgi:carboxyl-terminal processing protease
MGRAAGRFWVLTLLATTAVGADSPSSIPLAKGNSPGQQRGPSTASTEFVRAVEPVLSHIHRSYHLEEIPMDALAGRGLLGLYRLVGKTPPESLSRDPDHYLASVPGNSLQEKLATARDTLGDSGLRGEAAAGEFLKAVFATLDPFSTFASVDQSIRTTAESGGGVGLFLEDRPRGGSYFVRNVALGSIAQKQGIRPGDEILEIDRTPIHPTTPTAQVQIELTQRFHTQAGVTLKVRSLQGEVRQLLLRRAFNPNDPPISILLSDSADTVVQGFRRREEDEWDYWLDQRQGIALFRIGSIQSDTPAIVAQAMQQMSDGLKAVILDLRDSPIGAPLGAAELAGLFLEQNAKIATTRYRNTAERVRGEQSDFRGSGSEGSHWLNVHLVVLTGPDTSGAAEMTAAALQDHERGKIVGQRTRGKATIQQYGGRDNEVFQRRGASPRGVSFSYRLTVGVFVRPSGKNLNRSSSSTAADDWGVRPDVEVVLPAQMRRQVRAWWFEHDLLPPHSDQPSKLYDLRNDPVLDAAVRTLRQQITHQ